MEGRAQRSSELDQLASPRGIDSSVFFKNAENDAIGPQLFGDEHISLHAFEVAGVVSEVASARTDDDVKANVNFSTNALHQT